MSIVVALLQGALGGALVVILFFVVLGGGLLLVAVLGGRAAQSPEGSPICRCAPYYEHAHRKES